MSDSTSLITWVPRLRRSFNDHIIRVGGSIVLEELAVVGQTLFTRDIGGRPPQALCGLS